MKHCTDKVQPTEASRKGRPSAAVSAHDGSSHTVKTLSLVDPTDVLGEAPDNVSIATSEMDTRLERVVVVTEDFYNRPM